MKFLRQLLIFASAAVMQFAELQAVCGQVAVAEADPSAATSADSRLPVEFGLGQAWKLGQLVPVRVQLDPTWRSSVEWLEVESVDGDGVPVVYEVQLSPQSVSDEGVVWLAIRVGRQMADVSVRLLNSKGVLHAQSFELETVSQVLPSHQPLVLALGDSMGIEALARSSADGSSTTFSTIVLEQANQLPIHAAAYSSCDLLVISAANSQLLKSLNAKQWSAIDTWIRQGGACIVSIGDQVQDLGELAALQQLLPGEVTGTGLINNPAPLESLVATDEPLDAFACCLVAPQRGRIEMTLSDSLTRPVPWWLSYSHGLGTVRFVASDLGSPAFDDWNDRQRLWSRLLAPYLDRGSTEMLDEKQVGDSSFLGYNDLVGQLRATLDVFPGVRVITFGQVAAMLIGILLLIGPVDYFVSVKWLKRPELSWGIAGSMLLLSSLGLLWLLNKIRPSEVHLNTAQIIDVDEASRQAQGRLWSHVYSGSARMLDVTVATADPDVPVRLDWQGLPGRGLGGLLSQLSTDRGMPTYTIATETDGHTRLQGVGIPAAGTKCLVANWSQPLDLTTTSKLREIPGVDQLEGELANPLSVDLLDPVLFYHNWYYSLNSRIPAGQSTQISFDTIPKDIVRRLNGRHTVNKSKGNESNVKWDPADRGSIDRLLELMMFYKSAAGQAYTGLTHRYQSQLDQSNLLQTDRAILVGRLEQPWGRLQVSEVAGGDQQEPVEVQQNLDRVWCRIAIPVQQNTKK